MGDREQAISMQRCVPPDRSIQGPPLVSSSPLSDRAPGLWRDLLVEIADANHLYSHSQTSAHSFLLYYFPILATLLLPEYNKKNLNIRFL